MDFTFNLANFEYFLLIMVRISTFVFVAPLFGQRGIPPQAKIGFSGAIAIMILYTVKPVEAVYYSTLGFGILVFKEAITGLLIGYAANICSSIITHTGFIIDMEIGISMASEFDPVLNTQVTVTGNIYQYFMLLFLIITNMYQFILRAMIDSFAVIPLGGAVFEPDYLITAMIDYVTNVFVIGFRIFLPVFATMLIMNVVLGVMAKVAQQMNMFSVGIQLKIIAGLSVLFLTVYLYPEVCRFIFDQMSVMMREMVEGMY